MKKSNKLILAGFLLVVFIITAINVTIYAKYKNGDYTIYHAEDYMEPVPMDPFPGIRFISVYNIVGGVATFGDTAEVEKGIEKNRMQYSRVGDTLVITGMEKENQRGRYRTAFTFPKER
jgi:hypothetical protein